MNVWTKYRPALGNGYVPPQTVNGAGKAEPENKTITREAPIKPAEATLDRLIDAQRTNSGYDTGSEPSKNRKVDLSELTQAFEKSHGRIVSAYYCKTIRGAAILTQSESKTCRRRPWRKDSEGDMHLHMRYPHKSIVAVSPDFEESLWRCSALSTKANQLLRTKNSHMIHRQMHSLVVYLLSVLDTLEGVKDEREKARRIGRALQRANTDLDGAEHIYASTAVWGAQLEYSKGMLWGIIGLFLLVGLLAALHMLDQNTSYPDLERFLISLGAGGVGAIVSVMQRMSSNSLRLNVLAEHKALNLIGSFRPIIGALFGAAFVVLLTGGLLNISPAQQTPPRTLYFLAGLSFLAGFSERFAPVTLGGVSQSALEGAAPEVKKDAARSRKKRADGPEPN